MIASLDSRLLRQVKDVTLSVAGSICIHQYAVAVLDAALQEGGTNE